MAGALSGPSLVIVAGPNGAGKSTLTRTLRGNISVIDPDRIAAENGLSPVSAGKEALRLLRAHIRQRRSVIVETTLSGHTYLKAARDARQSGFRVEVHYVCVDLPEIAILRVRQRVLGGGHDVPPEDVLRRFRRSLDNLPKMIQLSDNAVLYDNSGADGYEVLARVGRGNIDKAELLVPPHALPGWAREVLGILS